MRIEPVDATKDSSFPIFVHAEVAAEGFVPWVEGNTARLHALLAQHGVLVLRETGLTAPEDFEKVAIALHPEPWTGLSNLITPRKRVAGGVLTSTEYDPDYDIRFHSEFSANPFAMWPKRLFFFCVTPSPEGGATPVANNKQVYRAISERTKQEFAARGGLRYSRLCSVDENDWREIFKTTDPSEVERRCAAAGVEVRWMDDHKVMDLRWTLPATARHPDTGTPLWFNQAHICSWRAMREGEHAYFEKKYGPELKGMNCVFADGTEIPTDMLDECKAAFERHHVATPWKQGDIMMIDNSAYAHGRRTFKGPRRILTAMRGTVQLRDARLE